MNTRYKHLPQGNEIKFRIFRREKNVFYLFTVIIGTDFHLDRKFDLSQPEVFLGERMTDFTAKLFGRRVLTVICILLDNA